MIRINNGINNKEQNYVSEETRLINITYVPDKSEFYFTNETPQFFPSLTNFWKNIISKIQKIKYLKHYGSAILLIYFYSVLIFILLLLNIMKKFSF